MTFDDDLIAEVTEALENGYSDAEDQAFRLQEIPEPTLEKAADRLVDTLFLCEPPMAMRILNHLPASFTRRHVENHIYYLNHTGDPGYAAGTFVTFKARSAHRTKLCAWELDKALWKWMRRSDNAALEAVLRHLGPDWGELWADHVAVVYGAGRPSRRLRRIARRM